MESPNGEGQEAAGSPQIAGIHSCTGQHLWTCQRTVPSFSPIHGMLSPHLKSSVEGLQRATLRAWYVPSGNWEIYKPVSDPHLKMRD